ncbi:hypothetical protein OPV22_029366 [Ensete ventricosum]|uniref:Uncharacterized protein n=1 Tax=Ensete ventricosum TaxID=4639 RepID=A0AAV8Q5N1_ENSVE|nr:hypothetical protein OPV22_029366 [Ensete ventricosum]
MQESRRRRQIEDPWLDGHSSGSGDLHPSWHRRPAASGGVLFRPVGGVVQFPEQLVAAAFVTVWNRTALPGSRRRPGVQKRLRAWRWIHGQGARTPSSSFPQQCQCRLVVEDHHGEPWDGIAARQHSHHPWGTMFAPILICHATHTNP